MPEKTKIEWCDHTSSPWIGCTKVSNGCKFCYADGIDNRRFSRTLGGTPEAPQRHWGKGAPRWNRLANFRKDCERWNKQRWKCDGCQTWQEVPRDGQWMNGEPFRSTPCRNKKCRRLESLHLGRPKVFASLCDPFDEEVPIEMFADYLRVIHDTPNLDHLVLTKRPEWFFERMRRASDLFESVYGHNGLELFDWIENDWLDGEPPPNVWMGVSVEDQETADRRIPALLSIPAKVRFLSCEPLLGPVNLGLFGTIPKDVAPSYTLTHDRIDWVIVGGESGSNARPMHPDWARSIRDQCQAAGVPFFFKQWGEHGPLLDSRGKYCGFARVGKKAAGRLLDGQEWSQFPKASR